MRPSALICFFALLLMAAVALAVTPMFWENFTQDELLRGTFTRVSLGWDSRLMLAPAYDMIYDTGQPYIFSLVRDQAGNLYAGTGHEGKVLRIDSQGNGAVYLQSKELDIFALALDPTGVLYVASSPDGKVYKVTGFNQATEYCSPEEKYIWALQFDEAGNLYVGTGPRGIIYKVDKTGKKSTFYDGDDTHIVCLARDNQGNLLAGTSPGGLVLEINAQGKAFALLDSPLEEIRALAVDRFGTIYCAAAGAKAGTGESGSKPEISTDKSGALTLGTIQLLSSMADRSRDSKSTVSAPGGASDTSGAKSAIYAISKTGGTETIYSSNDSLIYDLVVRADGSVIAATGTKGRLLSINSAKQVTVVTDSAEEQVTRLVAGGDNIWAGGSNQGKVYKLQNTPAQTGSYESRVLDAKTAATWGRIAWRAGAQGGGVEISTRSGNTEKPGSTWSDWSPAYTNASGQQISSPPARYLQWRASFKRGSGATPETLERMQIAYLQQNIRPQVVSLQVLPPGIALQKQPSLSSGSISVSSSAIPEATALNSPRERNRDRQPLPPRQNLQTGAQSFTWKATDENDDTLEYALYFKGEGETEWKLLAKELSDAFYTLNSDALPDGLYALKVVASDAASNPYGKFLIGEMVSKPFVISNATPQVEIAAPRVNGKKVDLQFRAKVQAGRIASAEFSIDGGEWFLVFPTDGIADSAQEDFQVSTSDLAAGEHVLGVRATDGIGSTGTAKVIIKIQ